MSLWFVGGGRLGWSALGGLMAVVLGSASVLGPAVQPGVASREDRGALPVDGGTILSSTDYLDARRTGTVARPEIAHPDSPRVEALQGAAGAVVRQGISARVLDAYKRAAASTARTDPSCHLDWSLLAGIGHVESHHASGVTVDASGDTSPAVLGPRLDGTGEFAAIRDTDGGRYDGDGAWDRAVGPMQFIPSSWAVMGADGNGDGRRDPNNVYDASLAAATYLCGGDRDLSRTHDRRQAVFGYNHSWDYVDLVLRLAAMYAAGDLTVASTTGGPGRVSSPAGGAGHRQAGDGRGGARHDVGTAAGASSAEQPSGSRAPRLNPAPAATSPSPSPRATATRAPGKGATASPDPAPSPSRSTTPTAGASPTATGTPGPTGTPTPTPTGTAGPCPTPDPSASASPTPTRTATAAASPSPSPTRTATAAASPSPSPTPSGQAPGPCDEKSATDGAQDGRTTKAGGSGQDGPRTGAQGQPPACRPDDPAEVCED